MVTQRLPADASNLEETATRRALDQAAAILRAGGTVALPTETVYGLGANALDATAVARIFEAKQRPGWDPLIVHISDEAMLRRVVEVIPPKARVLMEAFWPGPLTLLLPRTAAIPDVVTAGRVLVGVRMPAHPVALELIRRAGVPIAAPSANRFGHTSPTTAQHVLDDLDGRIDAVLDAGPTERGVESTVLDAGTSPMVVYRPGAITLQQIRQVAGPVEMFADAGWVNTGELLQDREGLPSPGVGLRHYAPQARLELVEAGDGYNLTDALLEGVRRAAEARVGVMLPGNLPLSSRLTEGLSGDAVTFDWGDWGDLEVLAQRLFAGLRFLDGASCDVIVCPLPPERGIGAAIRDRLQKAARRV